MLLKVTKEAETGDRMKMKRKILQESEPSVPSLPHAPEQESAVAQEGSFVVPHGLPPSSAYVTIVRNLPTAERSREAPETREQSEFTEDRRTIVVVLETSDDIRSL